MKRIVSLVLALALSAGLFSAAFAARDAIYDIALDSQGVFLVNAETDTVLYEKAADELMAPAALTEIVTALCALEATSSPKTESVTVPSLTLFDRVIRDGGLHMQAEVGESFTVFDLCAAMMLGSCCDAAELLAYHCGNGSVAAFVETMNKKCAELGMEHTHFSNAHGLFADPTHVTTPRDAATALRAALKNPFFAEVFSLRSYTVPATKRNGARTYKTSLALFDPEDPAYCEGLTGAKGGFTDEAGRCLATHASRGGVSYFCVLMGANLDSSRHYPNRNMTVSETQTLIEYVYTHFDLRTLYRKGELVATLPIADSEQTAAIAAGEEIRALIRTTSEPDLRLELPENLTAEEMENGKAVGTLTLVFDENTVATCPLLIRYGGEEIHVMGSFEKAWNRFTGAVSGLFRTDKVFVILLILLLVVIGVCIPAVKITQHLHKKFSRPPKH